MRDDTAKWPAPSVGVKPDVAGGGVTLRHVSGLRQTLISGPLAKGLSYTEQARAVEWPDAAKGGDYAVSLRRDRILLVGGDIPKFGWLDAHGLAVSDVSAGYDLVEICGPGAFDLLRTGTEVSLTEPSRSALRLWQGYGAILYRYEASDCFRMHVASGHFEGVWEMLIRQVELIAERFN